MQGPHRPLVDARFRRPPRSRAAPARTRLDPGGAHTQTSLLNDANALTAPAALARWHPMTDTPRWTRAFAPGSVGASRSGSRSRRGCSGSARTPSRDRRRQRARRQLPHAGARPLDRTTAPARQPRDALPRDELPPRPWRTGAPRLFDARGPAHAFVEEDTPWYARTAPYCGRGLAPRAVRTRRSLAHPEFPELVALLLSEDTIRIVESGTLWTDSILNVMPSSIVSTGIIANNVTVTLAAYCVGVIFGLGTFYLIALNGLMIGGLSVFHGAARPRLPAVRVHGGPRPGRTHDDLPRRRRGRRARRCTGAAARTHARGILPARRLEDFALHDLLRVLLVGCGLIEGFISAEPSYPFTSRAVIGIASWLIAISAATGLLYRRNGRHGAGSDAPSRAHPVVSHEHRFLELRGISQRDRCAELTQRRCACAQPRDLLAGCERSVGIEPAARLAPCNSKNSDSPARRRPADACLQQAHGLAELAVAADVVEVQHQNDARVLAAERERTHRGGQRIALARQGRGRGQAGSKATDGGHAVARREAEQRHVGKRHEAHPILVLHRVLREAAGGVHVVAEGGSGDRSCRHSCDRRRASA